METDTQNHQHNGIDSKKLKADVALVNCPQAVIANPTGGAVVDVEARAAIVSILDALRNTGIIRT